MSSIACSTCVSPRRRSLRRERMGISPPMPRMRFNLRGRDRNADYSHSTLSRAWHCTSGSAHRGSGQEASLSPASHPIDRRGGHRRHPRRRAASPTSGGNRERRGRPTRSRRSPPRVPHRGAQPMLSCFERRDRCNMLCDCRDPKDKCNQERERCQSE